MTLLRRLYLQWLLGADERYLRLLARDGGLAPAARALSRHCEALRVRLALIPGTPSEILSRHLSH